MSDTVKKVRNYSFADSKRLPSGKMTQINGMKIPSMPGSCYHAIMCCLAQNKDSFCTWEKIIDLTEKFIRQYGGPAAWKKFKSKNGVKTYQQRIKDNTHTLTRTGRDCYGRRLHEQGMAIYFFKDGAILFTGGEFKGEGDSYDVIFPDGKQLQTRYRGTAMTHKEYKKFLDAGYIDQNGKLLNIEAIRLERKMSSRQTLRPFAVPKVQLCLTLSETFNQETAYRLEALGFKVEQALENELIGSAPEHVIDELKADHDVVGVDVSGR